MKAHLINMPEIIGLRHIAKIDILKINPTPIATPAKEIKGSRINKSSIITSANELIDVEPKNNKK